MIVPFRYNVHNHLLHDTHIQQTHNGYHFIRKHSTSTDDDDRPYNHTTYKLATIKENGLLNNIIMSAKIIYKCEFIYIPLWFNLYSI